MSHLVNPSKNLCLLRATVTCTKIACSHSKKNQLNPSNCFIFNPRTWEAEAKGSAGLLNENLLKKKREKGSMSLNERYELLLALFSQKCVLTVT